MVLLALVTSETMIGGQQRKEMIVSVFTQVKSLCVAKRFQPFNPPVKPKIRPLDLDQDQPRSSSNLMAREVISFRQAISVYCEEMDQ
jgi:hypothetical protein